MTFINKQWNEADILSHFVDEHLGVTASAEDVAQWLNAKVPQAYQITRATAYNWMSDIHAPGWQYLMAYSLIYPQDDPRHEMADAIINRRMADVHAVLAQVPA